MPPPLISHAACSVSGLYRESNSNKKCFRSVALLFGGLLTDNSPTHDIFLLDMTTMRWKALRQITNQSDSRNWPQARDSHSLTMISSRTALLFGGRGNHYPRMLSDCWKLNIENCLASNSLDDIWTRCEQHESHEARCGHKAVQEPHSKRVWIIGGIKEYGGTL